MVLAAPAALPQCRLLGAAEAIVIRRPGPGAAQPNQCAKASRHYRGIRNGEHWLPQSKLLFNRHRSKRNEISIQFCDLSPGS